MGLFRYEAVDKTGKTVRGVMDASDEQQVAQKLGNMGYTPQSVYSAHGQPPAQNVTGQQQPANVPRQAAPRPQGGIEAVTLANGVPISTKSRVPASALAVFFRQLATLVRSGRPLYQSLTDIRVSNSGIRGLLPVLQDRISQGQKLSGAMAEYPRIFPVHAIASVWCGELSGRLDIALDEIASDFELEASEIRYGRFGWFLAKASLIALIFVLPMSNMESLLLPAFKETLKTANPSPWDTLRFIWQTYMQTMFWKSFTAAFIVVAGWIIFGYVKKIPAAKNLIDKMVLKVPVWGTLQRYRGISRFSHELDHLFAAGIPYTTAWEAASLTPRNSAVAEKLRLASTSSQLTSGVSGLIIASGAFDEDDIGILSAGEKSGQLPDVLSNMSATHNDRASAQRTKARVISVHLLILFSIIFTGYILIRMVGSYISLAFSAGDIIGQ